MRKYRCVCCGNYTLFKPPQGVYEFCHVCDWTDDYVQTQDPNFSYGANKLSLNQARENYKRFGTSDLRRGSGREPRPDELPEKNKHWKKYKCACCGNFTFPELNLWTYICPVCYWENRYIKPETIDHYDGDIPMLDQARENYKSCGAFAPHAVSFVRKPYPEELPENN